MVYKILPKCSVNEATDNNVFRTNGSLKHKISVLKSDVTITDSMQHSPLAGNTIACAPCVPCERWFNNLGQLFRNRMAAKPGKIPLQRSIDFNRS